MAVPNPDPVVKSNEDPAVDVTFAANKGWTDKVLEPLQSQAPKIFLEYLSKCKFDVVTKHFQAQSSTWDDLFKKNREYAALDPVVRIEFEALLLPTQPHRPSAPARSHGRQASSDASGDDETPHQFRSEDQTQRWRKPWPMHQVKSFLQTPSLSRDVVNCKENAVALHKVLLACQRQLELKEAQDPAYD